MTDYIPATPLKDMGPTSSTFDVSNRDSMGDPEFVAGRVQAMMEEARVAWLEGTNPAMQIPEIIYRYADELSATNEAYIQTMSPQAQSAFLRARGCGSEDDPADLKAPVQALLAHTLDRLGDALMPFYEGLKTEDQFGFEVAAALEDCQMLLIGLDNPAD